MRIVLVRHGDAHKHSPTGADRDRVLSMRGRAEAEALGEALVQAGCLPERLISSPFERCIRTAEIIGEIVGRLPTPDDRLAAEEPLSGLVALIQEIAAGEEAPGCVAIVGHNPRISELAVLFEHGPGHPRDMVALGTGEGVVLDVDPSEPIGTAKMVRRFAELPVVTKAKG